MMREYRHGEDFKSGRYGIVCPNNQEYREYVKACLTEMNTMYDFEGMFLDMTFFPEVCYCASCRERYKKETGKELPRKIDWKDPDWLDFVYRRDLWMAAASIMRENNIPFEVIGTKNIDTEDADVMILSHVAAIRDEEMDKIEAYVNRGGNLYISGPVGHPRLQKLLGIEVTLSLIHI